MLTQSNEGGLIQAAQLDTEGAVTFNPRESHQHKIGLKLPHFYVFSEIPEVEGRPLSIAEEDAGCGEVPYTPTLAAIQSCHL